jgi:glutathione synthase
MTLNIGFVMDPIDSINPNKDSTLAMIRAAIAKGWNVYYMEQKDLYIMNGIAYGLQQTLNLFEDQTDWYRLGTKTSTPLSKLNIIMMRKDPPFDNEYIYSTYILELAENEGSLIVNKPQSLRDANEKLYTAHFPHCSPDTLVSKSARLFREFLAEHQDIILKPLDGMGGTSIFRVRESDPNISVIIETLTDYGSQLAMAQKFIPEITEGDKRILVIDGIPVPFALARIPAKGETRGNLAAGGRGVSVPLSEHDYWIVEQVAPTLIAKGLIFVGLDVIGDYLTEINVTSPTCIQEIDKANNLDIAKQLMDCLESKL